MSRILGLQSLREPARSAADALPSWASVTVCASTWSLILCD